MKELIFGIMGGLGLFIFGLLQMSEGLRRASGEKMRRALSGLTNNPLN